MSEVINYTAESGVVENGEISSTLSVLIRDENSTDYINIDKCDIVFEEYAPAVVKGENESNSRLCITLKSSIEFATTVIDFFKDHQDFVPNHIELHEIKKNENGEIEDNILKKYTEFVKVNSVMNQFNACANTITLINII